MKSSGLRCGGAVGFRLPHRPVEPVDEVVIVDVAAAEHLVAQQRRDIGVHMPDVAPHAGGRLHATGELHPGAFVVAECRGQALTRPRVVPEPGQGGGQRGAVEQGLPRSLGQVLQHRVRGVAEQGDPALRPGRDGVPVVHGPPVVALQRRDRHAHRLAHPGVGAVQFLGGAPVLFALQVFLAAEDRHLVVEFAGAHGVLHEVQARAHPDDDVVEGDPAVDGVEGHRAPIGDVTGADHVVGDDPLAHRRVQTVRADEQLAGVLGAVGASHDHVVTAVLDVGHPVIGVQGDVRFRPGRLQQCLEQVAAVQHDVGAAVTSPGVGEVEVGELLTADGVTEDESTRQDGQREDLLQHAHLVEHAGDVGSELQPRTDLGEVGRAFEDADPHPPAGEHQGRPQPTDPTSSDDHLFRGHMASSSKRTAAAVVSGHTGPDDC